MYVINKKLDDIEEKDLQHLIDEEIMQKYDLAFENYKEEHSRKSKLPIPQGLDGTFVSSELLSATKDVASKVLAAA